MTEQSGKPPVVVRLPFSGTIVVEGVRLWARECRVWGRGGQVPRTCPGLVHTVRATALGAQDASTSSPLGVAEAVS